MIPKERGLLHIYCGDGKGKTTAAVGLAVRAAGAQKKVLFARFLKNNQSGELPSLKLIPGIELVPIEKEFGFIRSKANPVWEAAKEYYSGYFEGIAKKAMTGAYDLLVLDEINASVSLEIIDLQRLLDFLQHRPEHLEVVLTGRNPAPELVEMADYVSEIQKRKHPFDQGIHAREGIEY